MRLLDNRQKVGGQAVHFFTKVSRATQWLYSLSQYWALCLHVHVRVLRATDYVMHHQRFKSYHLHYVGDFGACTCSCFYQALFFSQKRAWGQELYCSLYALLQCNLWAKARPLDDLHHPGNRVNIFCALREQWLSSPPSPPHCKLLCLHPWLVNVYHPETLHFALTS